ncbi:MAG: ABC-type transport auxiliary lipoprotein family protein [Deltaproteobacteria bacterium]|jgi:hypothetical protein|nr:ABC-type transport auxiliary lipoprotein family protein [Deltaproteobacteria bacterium]
MKSASDSQKSQLVTLAPALRLAILSLMAVVILSGGFLPGCGFSRPYPAIRSFALKPPDTNLNPAKARNPLLVQVTSGGAAPQYETRKLVYKIGQNEFTEDFYNELVGMPSRLAADLLASYLENYASRFRATLGVSSQSPDISLDIYLLALHGDYSLSPPRATAELKVTVSYQRGSRARTILSKTYIGHQELPANAPDRPSALVTGLGQALATVMAEIASDMAVAVH